VQYHRQLLRIESTTAGQAYHDLFEKTSRQHRISRRVAWSDPMSAVIAPVG